MSQQEQEALLSAYWQVLRDHYLWHATVGEIAKDCGFPEREVHDVIVQAWKCGIGVARVEAYAKQN